MLKARPLRLQEVHPLGALQVAPPGPVKPPYPGGVVRDHDEEGVRVPVHEGGEELQDLVRRQHVPKGGPGVVQVVGVVNPPRFHLKDEAPAVGGKPGQSGLDHFLEARHPKALEAAVNLVGHVAVGEDAQEPGGVGTDELLGGAHHPVPLGGEGGVEVLPVLAPGGVEEAVPAPQVHLGPELQVLLGDPLLGVPVGIGDHEARRGGVGDGGGGHEPHGLPRFLGRGEEGLEGVPSAWMASPPFTVFTPQEKAFPAALDSVT